MFIVWKGWGFLVPIIGLVSLAMGAGNRWGAPIAMIVAAAAIYVIAKKLDGIPGKVFIDPETDQEVEFKAEHSLYFIKMKYWPLIFVVLGILSIFFVRP